MSYKMIEVETVSKGKEFESVTCDACGSVCWKREDGPGHFCQSHYSISGNGQYYQTCLPCFDKSLGQLFKGFKECNKLQSSAPLATKAG